MKARTVIFVSNELLFICLTSPMIPFHCSFSYDNKESMPDLLAALTFFKMFSN